MPLYWTRLMAAFLRGRLTYKPSPSALDPGIWRLRRDNLAPRRSGSKRNICQRWLQLACVSGHFLLWYHGKPSFGRRCFTVSRHLKQIQDSNKSHSTKIRRNVVGLFYILGMHTYSCNTQIAYIHLKNITCIFRFCYLH